MAGRKRIWPPRIYPHKPSGRDRIRVNGVDYWLGPTGSEEAKKEYARLVHELADESGKPPARKTGWPSLAELVARWEEEVSPTLAEKERGHYRRALSVALRGNRASLRTDEFKMATLALIREEMQSIRWRRGNGRVGKRRDGTEERPVPVTVGWSRKVINRQVVRIRTVWRWAEESGLAPEGSWAHLRAMKSIPEHNKRVRQTEKRRPAFREHLDMILPRIRAQPVMAMLELQWLTGMRSGELRGMRAGEVDTSGLVWIYRPARHKNAWRGHARIIPLGPQAQAVLSPWIVGRDPGDHVFLTRTGRHYTANAYALAVCRAARKVNLSWLRPYCFRHGAKQRITRELGLDAARAVLGQKSIGTTNDYGTALDLSLALEAAQRCG